ncbi:type I DNA topoisomerase [Tsukamurella sp. M9C]|uniref:type I DNA topoisomerase n=1 Tax=Tsukamurella sp. M9C TaxID=2877520 RepID=UPI001CCB36B9|nr:type I DNA topoisomerase [Tsukamurella sp. M9C]MCA0157682.1 type I DNA topoisomerase [Tsukamurella sp. M9C]
MAARGKAAAGDGLHRLVIVESPAKGKKIGDFLGPDYTVRASMGHIRDLPSRDNPLPEADQGKPWARLGVDVDHDFEAHYVTSASKRSTVSELKSLLKQADELYLATDGDREGEAIAWHLQEVLKPKVPVKRMVFHEITQQAIQAAAEEPRELDMNLVDAQETRRILDRLYGYEVSPVLWRKVNQGLSAGRVQSVATRIIVDRERERIAFRTAGYWDIAAQLDAGAEATPRTFGARLVTVDGDRVATGRDFDAQGQLKKPTGITVLDGARANALVAGLQGANLTVTSVEEKPYTRKPYAPFMTSTLQQEASRKLRFNTDRTMQIAQRLYEGGYITYMRTDSTTLSETAIAAAREQAGQLYGPEFVHPTPRQYTRKVKNAQEAHEAIRPAGETFQTPGALASVLNSDEFRLYELIWQRTVASQMADVKGTTLSLRIGGAASTGESVEFAASGRTITFPGFLSAYVETVDDQAGGEADDAESRLPHLVKGQAITAAELAAADHVTSPPARYTEASLVKTLEELGIGRPSTYASIIKTIQDRGYVVKKGNALVPQWVAFAVIGLLEGHFGGLVDYNFTASMEDDLDEIAGGREGRVDWLTRFYFGDGGPEGDGAAVAGADGPGPDSPGLKNLVAANLDAIDARAVNSIPLYTDTDGNVVYVRVGRYGPYLERTVTGEKGEPEVQRANILAAMTPDELTEEVAEKLFATPQDGRPLGIDPATGHEIVAKEGRFGPYVTEILPEPEKDPEAEDLDAEAAKPKTRKKKADAPKPRTGSLLKTMDIETVTLEDALRLLSLPRVVGVDPESKEEITAQNGRYGPYLKKGTDSRSLATEDQMFTVTLEEALKLYAEPKRRGRGAAAAPPLRELGNDPVSGTAMVIKDGRFGPYVTDGETNASLRKGDEVATITDERASELLADRRARGPVKKKATKKAAAKKAPAKKAPAKKAAAKKTAAKKTTAKKTVAKKTTPAKKAPAAAPADETV